jgi:integrase
VRLIVEGASDQHIERSIARLAGGGDEVRALDGAKLRADEDGGAFLGIAFHVTPFGANQVAGPGSERGEGDLVLLVRLLHAGGLEVFQDHLGEGLLRFVFGAVFFDTGLSKHSRRQADYAWAVLARVLSWALDRGLVDANPCKKGGKLYHGSRGDRVWSEEDEAAFLREASPPLGLALMLALWTGQRQGNLLRLPWSAYDGSVIRLKQGKTGARVTVPVGAPLKAALDATRKRGPLILMNTRGVPWTANGFSASWRKACAAARISGLTFHDLRGTAVLRLSLAGCTVPEIATITGHSLRDVQVILDQNYFHRDVALAQSAITKLEAARAKKESES